MKKYFFTIFISLVIGFFLSFFLFNQYKGYKGISVYNEADEYIFLQLGVYDSKESLELSAINLENYIYRKDQDKYYMYIGITKNEENYTKMEKYFAGKNLKIEKKKFYISNSVFCDSIKNLDNILMNTQDEIVINEIINQGLNKYEEIILNGS